ncbi:pitrilysin family protein [Sphingosinicella sp. BN140058]|uniref:M16 family metallopeptidase n=1 Tax=Sphingosinicella sp. BN140058 TaxID=1892855 RepID=UPI0010100F40|nr:insulinase family protein [Sphingosinicella sp. BN140058]QAY77308.1 insulinase family protein [Sphingosinicella sp. BN140058]
MSSLRRSILPLLLLATAPVAAPGLTAPARAAAGDSGWFYRGSDIAPDPAWTFGTLPNGLRYAVRRNALPAGQVSIRLRMDVGSLAEGDQERGWAHYIEHMVFRGTAAYHDGEARQTWQRLGASFGSDTNASTQPTQTVYQLDLPKNDPASLELSLKILASMADTATFDPAIVEAERGVVLAEYGRRPELSVKLGDLTRNLFFSGLKFADRDTIGTEATLKGATAAGLKSFYERWYRPERATLVLVGDADPKMLEALVAKTFGGWAGTGTAPSDPEIGAIKPVPERTAALAYPGSPYAATLSWVRPYRQLPHTRAREREDLEEALAKRILNRRLEAKARGDAAFLNAQIGGDRSTDIADYTQVSVMAKEGRWKEALNEVYAILADALRAPPSDAEVAREIDNLRSSGRANVEGEPTRKSNQWAQALVTAIDGDSIVSSAPVTMALFEALAPQMTPATIEAGMKRLFAGSGPRMVLLSPDPVSGVPQALAAAEKAAPAARLADRKVTMDDLPALGAPGREVSREQIPDLGVTIVRFANGSSLVFKKTDFEKGRVNVSLRFGNGISGLPTDRRTIAWMGSLIGSTGIAGLDLDALERLLTGRRMTIGFGVAEDAFELAGTTNAQDLPDQLRLLVTKLAYPRWDATLFNRYKTAALENYQLSFSSASARASREFGGFNHDGDARWSAVERDEIARATPQDFQKFFQPLLQQGSIEAVVIGDADLEPTVAAMLKTVAALPKRTDVPPPPASLAVRPPRAGETARFDHQGDPTQAYAAIGWSTFGGIDNRKARRALALAGNMIQVRLFERLRDVEGATYSPNGFASSSEIFEKWGVLGAAAEVRPERTDLFFRLAREIVSDMAAKPAPADEFERAISPVMSGLDRRLKTNAYWLSAMESWSRKPGLIELTRTLESDYKAMTAEDVRAAVAAYVADEDPWAFTIVPARAAAASAAGPAAPPPAKAAPATAASAPSAAGTGG